MYYNNIWKIYFSPTETTKKAVSYLAEGLASQLITTSFKEFDFTLPDARKDFPFISSGDLVIFGVPTYAGRLPNLLLPYLNTIEGHGADAIAVVTFGNRSFDNSLIELRDILTSHNFNVAAAAALSCEHSFSYDLGAGRPDKADKEEIIRFAADFAISEIANCNNLLDVPGVTAEENYGGYYQPRDRHGNFIDIRKVKPLTDMDSCIECGTCAEDCPMGSIDHDDFTKVTGICIKCGACIKKCPQVAKYFDDEGYLYHQHELEEMYARRASNSFFL